MYNMTQTKDIANSVKQQPCKMTLEYGPIPGKNFDTSGAKKIQYTADIKHNSKAGMYACSDVT